MLRALLAKLPVWRVLLVSDDADAQRFYQQLGFEVHPDVMARLNWERLYDNLSERPPGPPNVPTLAQRPPP